MNKTQISLFALEGGRGSRESRESRKSRESRESKNKPREFQADYPRFPGYFGSTEEYTFFLRDLVPLGLFCARVACIPSKVGRKKVMLPNFSNSFAISHKFTKSNRLIVRFPSLKAGCQVWLKLHKTHKLQASLKTSAKCEPSEILVRSLSTVGTKPCRPQGGAHRHRSRPR